jgi:protein-arginine kinase activator protein McsA
MKINLLSDNIEPGKHIGVHFWIDIQDKANDKFFKALAERSGDKDRYLVCTGCKKNQTGRVFIDDKGKFYCAECYQKGLKKGKIKSAIPKIGG